MKTDLTVGSVWKTILRFSLPFLLANFLQTLYGLADLFIIGQFCDVSVTTAVSNGSQIMHMITVIIVGLAMGTTVTVGHAVGSGDKEKVIRSVGNTVTLFMLLSIILSAILLIFVDPIVRLMQTPTEATLGTAQYLTVCFIGIPFITAYNIISSVLRGMGDSKSPMCFIAVACGSNIALDLLFIGVFDWKALGAALATVIAQTLSVIIALVYIKKKRPELSLSAKDLKPNGNMMRELLRIGIPISLQDGFIQIAFLVITVIANMRGLNDAAAVGVVEKIISIVFLLPSAMMSTVSALSAQNIGAGRDDRARKILRISTVICIIYGIIASVILQFFAEGAVSVFTDELTVAYMGAQYLRSYIWDSVFAGIHFCFSGYFCARGMSSVSFIHNCISIVLIRIPMAYAASVLFPNNLFPMGIASPAGSLLSVIICVAVYIFAIKRKPKSAV